MRTFKKLLVAALATACGGGALAQQNHVPGTVVVPAAGQGAGPAVGQVPTGWVAAGAPAMAPASFPPPPQNGAGAMPQSFPQSAYGAGNYVVQNGQGGQQFPQGMPVGQNGQPMAPAMQPSLNGTAPLQPLTPPPDTNFEAARTVAAPFTPDQIKTLHKDVDSVRRARSEPLVSTRPEIRTVSVDLRPGAPVPILRTMPGETSTLMFLDSTGAPWPLAITPRYGNREAYDVDWLDKSHVVVVTAKTHYGMSNLTVFLAGSPTPIVIRLAAGEPASNVPSRDVDARLDIRVPGRGPNAVESAVRDTQLSLYDDTLQAFLDGIPPSGSIRLEAHGESPTRTQVWEHRGYLYVRTPLDMRSEFEKTMAAGDGTRVYRMAPSPIVTLSDRGVTLSVRLDIN